VGALAQLPDLEANADEEEAREEGGASPQAPLSEVREDVQPICHSSAAIMVG